MKITFLGKKRIAFLSEETPDRPKGDRQAKGKSTSGRKTEHFKPGKSDDAHLVDMGQKALEEMETIKQKEEKLDKETLEEVKQEAQKETKKKKKQRVRSKRYQSIKKDIDLSKKYSINEALELLEKYKLESFDESIEVHLVTLEKLSGSVNLPHGTGRKQKIVIADEKIIELISKGKIDFDVLIATPQMMPKLSKVAKILGPKGLMPNPKAGTISDKPEDAKKKLLGGQTRFKTEPKASLIHFTIGKVSFGKDKLSENLTAFIAAVKPKNIVRTSLSSTMSPGIKIELKS